MKSRLVVALVVMAVWFAALGYRLYELQVKRHDHFAGLAQSQQQDIVELEPPRGTIYDARGRELAVSVNAESLFANPAVLEDPAGVARKLAEALDLDRSRLERTLSSSRRFAWIARKLDPPEVARVRALGIEGLGFVEESKRYYPFRALGGHLLGFVGTDHNGLEGLERRYDSMIAGKGAERRVLRDALRKTLDSPDYQFAEVEPGQDLHLTLDATIQHIAERELAAAVEKTRSSGGMVVVLDPWTGGILAMTSMPFFDPNRFGDTSADTWRIRPITDVFEPGSTFKMITIATALEANLIDPNDLIDCEQGSITINRMRIRDHHPYDELTVREVLSKSSNVGSIKIGLLAGGKRLDASVRAFGFGRDTGVDLPGESPGMFQTYERWAPMTDVYLSFGHGIAVTALQLANSFAVVANGGERHRPHIVSSPGRKSEPPARVLHPAVARSMERLLEDVVENGTARRAAIPGYRVAGKTGTPQKIDAQSGRYSNSSYMASFVGFAPARAPRVVALVMLDDPYGGAEGGAVAAPMFSAIVGPVLNYLKVAPSEPVEPEWPLQVVAERESVDKSRNDRLLATMREEPLAPGQPALPDLAGLTAREALSRLAAAGIKPRLHGSGFVERQQPRAGTPLSEAGDQVELWLAPSTS